MKRLTSIILTLAMLMSCTVFAVSADASDAVAGTPFGNQQSYVLGDADGDGKVNTSDVFTMKKTLAGAGSIVDDTAADANRDKRINSLDALALRLSLAGRTDINDAFPVSTDETVGELTIDFVNYSEFRIVLPDYITEWDNEYYAAKELQNYGELATGYKPEISYEMGEHNIIMREDLTSTDAVNFVPGELRYDGYNIEIQDGDIVITGGVQHGCMYAVYQLLEEFFGVRFFDGDYRIYEAERVNIPADYYRHDVPQFEYRRADIDGEYATTYAFPMRTNFKDIYACDSSEYGYLIGRHFLNAHSYYYYDQFDANGNGRADVVNTDVSYKQPCFNTEDVYQHYFNGLIKVATMLRDEWHQTFIPGISQMSFSINDNSNFCDCRNCRVENRNYGHASMCVRFASRAADEFQEYFPGIKLYTIIYEKTISGVDEYTPSSTASKKYATQPTFKPSENLVVEFCGTGCNNHIIAGGQCGDNVTVLGGNNTLDALRLKAWAELAPTLHFWYYTTNFSYLLAPSPNIFNIYYDLKYCAEVGIDGVTCESNKGYSFEKVKVNLECRMLWNPNMSYDEFTYYLKEYLYLTYGDGYEYIYDYLLLQTAAGDAVRCFVNNHDRPWEMYSPEYVAEHYEEMLDLFDKARSLAANDAQRKVIRESRLHVDFLGLAATYETDYVNGDAAQRSLYTERYNDFYGYMKDNGLSTFNGDAYELPATCNLDTSPMEQFYVRGYTY